MQALADEVYSDRDIGASGLSRTVKMLVAPGSAKTLSAISTTAEVAARRAIVRQARYPFQSTLPEHLDLPQFMQFWAGWQPEACNSGATPSQEPSSAKRDSLGALLQCY